MTALYSIESETEKICAGALDKLIDMSRPRNFRTAPAIRNDAKSSLHDFLDPFTLAPPIGTCIDEYRYMLASDSDLRHFKDVSMRVYIPEGAERQAGAVSPPRIISLKVQGENSVFHSYKEKRPGWYEASSQRFSWDADIGKVQLHAPRRLKTRTGFSRKDASAYSTYTKEVTGDMDETIMGELRTNIKMAIGMTLEEQMNWTFRLKQPGTLASARFTAQSVELLAEMFESRDPGPEGRRQALLGVVSKHWRTIGTTDDLAFQTFVRKHMRGTMKFDWLGLSCEIIPPVTINDELRQSRDERKQLRKNKLDRRTVPIP